METHQPYSFYAAVEPRGRKKTRITHYAGHDLRGERTSVGTHDFRKKGPLRDLDVITIQVEVASPWSDETVRTLLFSYEEHDPECDGLGPGRGRRNLLRSRIVRLPRYFLVVRIVDPYTFRVLSYKRPGLDPSVRRAPRSISELSRLATELKCEITDDPKIFVMLLSRSP